MPEGWNNELGASYSRESYVSKNGRSNDAWIEVCIPALDTGYELGFVRTGYRTGNMKGRRACENVYPAAVVRSVFKLGTQVLRHDNIPREILAIRLW